MMVMMLNWISGLYLMILTATCNAQDQPDEQGIHLPSLPLVIPLPNPLSPQVIPLPSPLSPLVVPQLTDVHKIINLNIPYINKHTNKYTTNKYTNKNTNKYNKNTNKYTNKNTNNYINGITNYTSSSSVFPRFHDNFGFPFSTCPQQMTFPDVATYSGDPRGYPVDAITSELKANTLLLECLTREIVLPSALTIPIDPVLETATKSCKFLEIKMWSFRRYGGKCWILQNFQEVVTYVSCISKKCTNCDDFPTFGFHKSRCLHTYRYESVWVYCEGLPVQQRIKRERLIMPRSCTCQRIKCSSFFRK